MKPIEITLKNIGPFYHTNDVVNASTEKKSERFASETIQFGALEDIFLIRGETGSGKSTIFDAILYALYGAAGAGSHDGRELSLRSDFAPIEEKAFVDFTFRMNAKLCRVYRSFPTAHITKTGRQVSNNDGEVAFFLKDNEEEPWNEVTGTKEKPVSAKIIEFIGLSKEDFSKTILLPQGQFSDFLRQKPADRKEMLSKLFPDLNTVTSICAEISKDAKEAEAKLKEKEEELQNAREACNEEETKHKIEEIEAELFEAEKKLNVYKNDIKEKSAQNEQLKTRLHNAQKAQELKEKMLMLEQHTSDIAQKEAAIKKADEAKALSALQKNVFARRTDCTLYQKNAREEEKALSAAKMSMAQADSLKSEYEANKKEAEDVKIKLHDAKNACEKLTDFNTAVKKAQQAQGEIQTLYKTTVQDLLLATQKSEKIAADTKTAEEAIKKCETLIEEYQKNEEEQNERNKAESIARHLKDGSPCPVCGNTVHFPLPTIIVHLIDFAAKREAVQKEKEAFQKELASLAVAKASCTEFMSRAEALIDQLQAAAQKYDIALAQKEALVPTAAGTLSCATVKARQPAVAKAITDIATARETMNAFSQHPMKNESELRALIQELTQRNEALSRKISIYEADVQKARTALTKSEATVQNIRERVKDSEHALQKAEAELQEALEKSIFESEAEVEAALLPEGELAALKEECAAFHTALTETNAMLRTNPDKDADKDALKNELDAVQNTLNTAIKESAHLPEHIKNLASQKEALSSAVKNIADMQKEKDAFSKKVEPLLRLRNDIVGKKEHTKDKSPRIQFDSWVTRVYLEDIIQKANPRFRRFTNGQFSFTLREEGNNSKDLNVLVADSYTGTERSTNSLSGGQTFMASLSLALALTDVVQEKSGHITLDSLFIDEGFGSLDEKSLDTAIKILNEIREHRMVGIISHVEMLASAIESHIVVTKTPRGSTIQQKSLR